MSGGALVALDSIKRRLALVETPHDAKALCDAAEALRVLARSAGDREPEIRAAEYRIRAERLLGETLERYRARGLIRAGGAARIDGPAINSPGGRFKLVHAGIEAKLIQRARCYAALRPAEFERRLAERRAAVERGDKRVSVFLEGADKAATRAAKVAELAARQQALPERRYNVILADPEWRYEVWKRETGLDRAADNHYPTSDLATIQQREVPSIAAKNCLLALWAVVPMLDQAFCVLDAWGFSRFVRDEATGLLGLDKRHGRYVSSAVWVKYKPGAGIGMGHWFRVDHEILLIATRGDMPAPDKGTQARSVFDQPASAVHSRKPELVAEILEGYFPGLPKIELNRRGPPRPGWDAWGNEVASAEAAE